MFMELFSASEYFFLNNFKKNIHAFVKKDKLKICLELIAGSK